MRASFIAIFRQMPCRVYSKWKGYWTKQITKNSKYVCKKIATAGKNNCADCRCYQQDFEAERRCCCNGSQPYVHDDAGGRKRGQQDNDQLCLRQFCKKQEDKGRIPEIDWEGITNLIFIVPI